MSIACCADSSSSNRNISWVPDDNWFADHTSCRRITTPVVHYATYDKVRDFNISTGKRCYNFTTNKDQVYLIRGTFRYGDREGTPLGSSINVWFGVTPLSVVNSSEDSVVEGIFRAVDDQTNFCLVKNKGNLYISLLELRPLNETEYLNGQSSSILKVVGRFDLGRSDKENRYIFSTFF